MEKKPGNRAEVILKSLDGIQPAEVPPFFYTRLKARMENELVRKKAPAIFFRPAFLTASLSLFLVVNIIFLLMSQSHSAERSEQKPPGIESFAEAYNLNTVSVYE